MSDENEMGKEEHIELSGTVTEKLGGGLFKATTTDGREVTVSLSGKMRMHKVKVVVGDKVTLAVSPYNLNLGRITFRNKDERRPDVHQNNQR